MVKNPDNAMPVTESQTVHRSFTADFCFSAPFLSLGKIFRKALIPKAKPITPYNQQNNTDAVASKSACVKV